MANDNLAEIIIDIVKGIDNNKKLVYDTIDGDYDVVFDIEPKMDLNLINLISMYFLTIPKNQKDEKLNELLNIIEVNDDLIQGLFGLESLNIIKNIEKIKEVKIVDSTFMKLWKPQFEEGIDIERDENGNYHDGDNWYGFELIDRNIIRIYKKPINSNLDNKEFYENEYIVANIVNDNLIQY